jgi:hypothetical protein
VHGLRDLKIQKDIYQNKNKLLLKSMPRIFVLCTGGTFCSVHSPNGYIIESGVISRMKMFKSLYDKEFS